MTPAEWAARLQAGMDARGHRNWLKAKMRSRRLAAQCSAFVSVTEPKGHMAELADGWMPDWVKVPT